jgi:hypothetical protein
MEKEQKLTGLPMPLRPINESLLEIDILLKNHKGKPRPNPTRNPTSTMQYGGPTD